MRSTSKAARDVAYYATGTVLALAFLYPILYVLLRSLLGQTADVEGIGFQSLGKLTLDNYAVIFDPAVKIWPYIANSVVIATGTAVGTILVSYAAAYALARTALRFKRVIFAVLLAPLVVPFQGLLTPLSLVLNAIGLLDSRTGLVAVLVTYQLPFGIFLLRNTIEAVPVELEEAARVDGASAIGSILRIVVPLSWPGIVTVALFGFLAGWGDLLTSVVFLSDAGKYTLPILLTQLTSTVQLGVPVVHAGITTATACVAVIPVVLLFLFLQRQYAAGIIGGSIK